MKTALETSLTELFSFQAITWELQVLKKISSRNLMIVLPSHDPCLIVTLMASISFSRKMKRDYEHTGNVTDSISLTDQPVFNSNDCKSWLDSFETFGRGPTTLVVVPDDDDRDWPTEPGQGRLPYFTCNYGPQLMVHKEVVLIGMGVGGLLRTEEERQRGEGGEGLSKTRQGQLSWPQTKDWR